MALLKYTTEISVEKTIGAICGLLARAKAKAIIQEFDGQGHVIAISFRIDSAIGPMGFRLPSRPEAVRDTLNKQVMQRQLPHRYMNNLEQARRVAWRIVLQWLEAQLAMLETQQLTVTELFLAHAQTDDGRTVHERLMDRGSTYLALHEPGKK